MPFDASRMKLADRKRNPVLPEMTAAATAALCAPRR